jgi:hypothetical protein
MAGLPDGIKSAGKAMDRHMDVAAKVLLGLRHIEH